MLLRCRLDACLLKAIPCLFLQLKCVASFQEITCSQNSIRAAVALAKYVWNNEITVGPRGELPRITAEDVCEKPHSLRK